MLIYGNHRLFPLKCWNSINKFTQHSHVYTHTCDREFKINSKKSNLCSLSTQKTHRTSQQKYLLRNCAPEKKNVPTHPFCTTYIYRGCQQ